MKRCTQVSSQVNQQVSLVGQYVGQNRSIEDLEDESTLQLSGHFIVEVSHAWLDSISTSRELCDVAMCCATQLLYSWNRTMMKFEPPDIMVKVKVIDMNIDRSSKMTLKSA